MAPPAILGFLLFLPVSTAVAAPPSSALESARVALHQQLQAAARHAAERRLTDASLAAGALLAAPLGDLDDQRSRRLRELALFAEAALQAHAKELSRLSGVISGPGASSSLASLQSLRLDRFGTAELRLGSLAEWVEVAVHLRGRIETPDGAHPAAVVHFAERRPGRPPRVGRLVLPIARIALVDAGTGAVPAPFLGWQGAVLEELVGGSWSAVLAPRPPAGRRPPRDTEFCDAACSHSAVPGSAPQQRFRLP